MERKIITMLKPVQIQATPETMKAYIGIDPGSSGAIVAIIETGQVIVLRLNKCTDKDVWDFLNSLSFDYECKCVKEKVWAMPATNGDGSKRGMGAMTSFVFGENNGFVRGLLVAAAIPYEEKIPQTWQKSFGFKKEKGESQTSYKKRMRTKAEQLYPNIKITADVADALLIAHYCKLL